MHETVEQSTSENGPEPSLAKESSLNTDEDTVNDSTDKGVTEIEKDTMDEKKTEERPSGEEKVADYGNGEGVTPDTTKSAAPPPPVMKGTLSCDIDAQRHLIRGMWNYENSKVFPAQPFELIRTLPPDEDKHVLPKDGEFQGSFRLAYLHTTSKGKQKERIKVIPESGVRIKFTKIHEGEYKVDGTGTNQFGIFHINGTATKSTMENDNTYHVVLRKRYESPEQPPPVTEADNTTKVEIAKVSAPAHETPTEADTGPLPEPAKSYPSGVVCLRGNVYQEESMDLGLSECVQRIHGMWSSGLDFILADPQNVRGLCNRFEYEHKSTQPKGSFPVSGRYSGWFDLSNEDGSRTRINERDVTLKFRKNSAGYHNVEGKGSNVFGKYSITGTLTLDNIITIFRHFQPRKIKTAKVATTTTPPATITTIHHKPTVPGAEEPKLKLDDVEVIAKEGEPCEPIMPPPSGAYSAVSRGVLRVNNDGSHSCQGKWAVTREHFTNGQTSSFTFRLEAHFAQEAAAEIKKSSSPPRQFPLDSAMYKGSFQLRKQGTRHQTIIDHQVVMKFCENNQGSYNVHGKGINAIGEFNLIGTLVMSGKTGGQVELYRMYPPDKLAAPPAPPKPVESLPENGNAQLLPVSASGLSAPIAPKLLVPPPPQGIQRRESTRLVKLPSRLEDDDPDAQISRIMEKCSQILRIVREKDVELGGFFAEPVDPVSLGIPTYYQVIKEPMDLRTVQRKLDSQELSSPEEFARLVRLVFENAITFNVDPTHSVHQAARNLLIMFNQKIRDVDRMLHNIRRSQNDWDSKSGKKSKDEKKRKRTSEEPKSMKRRRLEEAQAMATANSNAVAALIAAAPSLPSDHVSRSEFNLLLTMIEQLQKQIVQTHTALAELCPGDENDATGPPVPANVSVPPMNASAPTAVQSSASLEAKKKPIKRKTPEPPAEPPAPPIDDNRPLTLAEQELLTETINELPPEHLGGVIQIIREAAPVGADEDEIDLEIDQLDARTQRKLLNHVSKFVKKPKGKARRTTIEKKEKPIAKKSKTGKVSNSKEKPSVPTQSEPIFAFDKDDSDSDSTTSDDGEIKEDNGPLKSPARSAATEQDDNDFKLTTDDHRYDDDENDDDLGEDLAAAWNMKPSTTTSKFDSKGADDDDAWGAAREQAAAAKRLEAERKEREEKMLEEAERIKEKRLAEEAEQVEKLKEERAQKEAEEKRLQEEKEKEAEAKKEAARRALREELEDVAPTVDLGDDQRILMKQYEQSFLDKDYGSASPSSDFGF